jgi:endonuclease-3
MRFATLIAMASASGKRSVSASASTSVVNGKRPRFVPPPLESIVKAEPDEIHSVTGLSRYSLRQRGVATSGDADTSSSSSVKVEDVEDTKASLSPSKKNKAMKIDPFATSPRKTSSKPIKIDLDASEARAAPKRWKEQYEVLIKQRKRIIAPVDTMGCQENGKDEKRKDISSEIESEEDRARRERFTILVSLMLSSQVRTLSGLDQSKERLILLLRLADQRSSDSRSSAQSSAELTWWTIAEKYTSSYTR